VHVDETGATSRFAAEKDLLNESNDAYARCAGTGFPADPAGYFSAVQSARKFLRDGHCERAIPLLERATREYPDNGDTWALLGVCRANVNKWIVAVDAFRQALELGVTPWDLDIDLNPNDMMIAIAKAYAQAGETEKSLTWLHRGLELRFDERPGITEAPEFASLLDNPEFINLTGLPPKQTLTRDEQYRYDIAYLREQVIQLHADPDHHTSAAALEQMLSDLWSAVPDLSDEEITARLDLVIGALGAGHDLFWPVSAKRGALLPFALKLYLFTDGLYIIDAYDPELIGARIDAFGETSTEDAYEIVARAFPGDNDMQARWMGVRHLTQAYTLEALGVVEDQASVSLTITDSSGVQRRITPERRAFTPFTPALKPPPGVPAPLYLSHLDENYWMQHLEPLDALYVQINVVVDEEEETLADFAARIGEEAQKPGVLNLILDLRHSPGGNGYLTPPVLRQLIRFDATPDKDRLYILIGRNTFSASQNMITDLDRIAEPVFVGEPSGSRPNALSESGVFRLPYSGLSGNLASQLHQHSWPEDHRIWIAPDIPVGLTSEDFFAGRDPSLEAVSALITAVDG
jgi:tetratricopeptide (TPR) repeat protein